MNTTTLICKSEYVTMRDGVRLAVSTWLDQNEIQQNLMKRPAVLVTTRYWRATMIQEDDLKLQSSYSMASYFILQGYILVVADARGSGASFGCRQTEISPAEVDDIGELIDWVAQQEWCDGRVATTGTSYTASTTLYSLVCAPASLKKGVCRAPDFDAYRHLFAPGGVVNSWFIEAWGNITDGQDRNDVKMLLDSGILPPAENDADHPLGVRPVDEDIVSDLPYCAEGSLLAAAIAEHKSNFNLLTQKDALTFIENPLFDHHRVLFDPVYQEKVEQSTIPLVIRCGWHDAGTQLGALSLFVSFKSPMRVILGPWSHVGDSRADPFQAGDGKTLEAIPFDDVWSLTVQSLNAIFKQNNLTNTIKPIDDDFGVVEYYTLGENRWKTTRMWPLPDTQRQRLYLSSGHQLSMSAPTAAEGSDHYSVNPHAGTGLNNRWHTQTGNPIFFPDRQEEDKKLLVYDTPPLESDIEITGHPVVHLLIRSTATDGQFFVYLETIDPDGRVRMLTEGQLRGLHRKVSDEAPPYTMFGPYHSLKEKDAQPLIPGEVAEISFDLFPISVLLKKGQRIRLAIAGADKDVFAPIPGCEKPEIIVERNSIFASYIDLPIV